MIAATVQVAAGSSPIDAASRAERFTEFRGALLATAQSYSAVIGEISRTIAGQDRDALAAVEEHLSEMNRQSGLSGQHLCEPTRKISSQP